MRQRLVAVIGVAVMIWPGIPLRAISAWEQAPPPGSASQAAGLSWGELSSSPVGRKLRLTLHDGSIIEGHFVSVSADAVVLNRNKLLRGPFSPRDMSPQSALTLQRDDIVFIERAGGAGFGKGLLVGILVWVVLGLVLGAAGVGRD